MLDLLRCPELAPPAQREIVAAAAELARRGQALLVVNAAPVTAAALGAATSDAAVHARQSSAAPRATPDPGAGRLLPGELPGRTSRE